MTGKRKSESPGASNVSGHKFKGSRHDSGAEGFSAEKKSFLRGSAYIIACFGCFLLGFRLSWEGKAVFLGAYRGVSNSGKQSTFRESAVDLGLADSDQRGVALQNGLDLRPGAWESGQGDKYGAGVADGEWERIEERILASAGRAVNASEGRRGEELLRKPPASPSEHPWVGRHNISIRQWPHPDAGETLLAHALIAAVQIAMSMCVGRARRVLSYATTAHAERASSESDLQQEQQRQFGVPLDRRKRVIVVTPTYRRSFQRVHLSHLTDTLRLAPEPLSWLVVEAGGPTEETQAILSKTGLSDIHLLPVPGVTMPDVRAPERPTVEDQLRDVALGYISRTAMEGVVVFADDSSVLRLALFQELQKVQWFAGFSVGMLVQGGGSEVDPPVQGPVCGPGGEVAGWHAADHELLKLKKSTASARRAVLSAKQGGRRTRRLLADEGYSAERGDEKRDLGGGREHTSGAGGRQVIQRRLQQEEGRFWEAEPFIPKLEWVGFAFNARLLWAPEERPPWLKEWKPWGVRGTTFDPLLGDLEDDLDPTDLLLRMVEDETQVETLGRCGKDVLAWWLRVEAADGGGYPGGWWLAEGLPVVAEAKAWGEEEWRAYEGSYVEEKKKKKKKGKKKKKKAPEETKAEEDAAARQAAEQAAADEARRLEEEKKRALEEEAARQAEEERQRGVAESEKAEQTESSTAEGEQTRVALEGEGEETEGSSDPNVLGKTETISADPAKGTVRRKLSSEGALEGAECVEGEDTLAKVLTGALDKSEPCSQVTHGMKLR